MVALPPLRTPVFLHARQGEIIFLLDADDIFFPHKVETMVNYFLQVMPQNPAVMISHCLEMTNKEGIILFYRPGSLRTLNGHKKSCLFEKLTDPEAVYRHVQKWGFLRYAPNHAAKPGDSDFPSL